MSPTDNVSMTLQLSGDHVYPIRSRFDCKNVSPVSQAHIS